MGAEAGSGFGQTRGFLFADLRGYTDFVERHGDDAAARLLERYRQIVRGVVDRQSGAEVRTEGDSFFVLFSSASRAVVAGLEIVDEAARHTAEHPDLPIRVGVGVHAGETAETEEGPVGSAVNVAARICAQAAAGEVLVSDTVRGLTRTRQVAKFDPVGTRRLKGINEPMTLYRAAAIGPDAVASGGRTGPAVSLGGGWSSANPWSIGGVFVAALALIGIAGYAVLSGFGSSPPTETPANGPTASGSQPAVAATDGSSTASPAAPMPTGMRIIYSRQVALREQEGCDGINDAKLHVIDPENVEAPPYRLTLPTDLYERSPEWSSDGSQIVFAGDVQNAPSAMFGIQPDGMSLRTITEAAVGPFQSVELALAPNASSVAYTTFEAIWLAPLDGSGPQLVAGVAPPESPDEPPPEPSAFYPALDYLPDGRLLIVVSPVDGSEAHLEIISPGSGDAAQAEFNLKGLSVESIAVAADGDLIALSAGSEEGSTLHVGHLSQSGADLEQVAHEIANAKQPAFAPDGGQLAFQGGTPGEEAIYVLDLTSGLATQLTDPTQALGCSPTWSMATEGLAGPRPSPSPGELFIFERGVLLPGTHRLDRIQPNMELTFPEGWHARRNYVDGWSVARIGETLVQEVDSGRIQVGLTGPCFDDEQVILGPRPSDLADWIQGREDLIIERVSAINLGGYTGLSMDVTPREGSHCDQQPEFQQWVLFFIGEDVDKMGDPSERLRLVALDVRGVTVAYQVYSDADNIDAYWNDHALPLLETLAFPIE